MMLNPYSSGSLLRNHSWKYSGDLMRCWGSNPARLHERLIGCFIFPTLMTEFLQFPHAYYIILAVTNSWTPLFHLLSASFGLKTSLFLEQISDIWKANITFQDVNMSGKYIISHSYWAGAIDSTIGRALALHVACGWPRFDPVAFHMLPWALHWSLSAEPELISPEHCQASSPPKKS